MQKPDFRNPVLHIRRLMNRDDARVILAVARSGSFAGLMRRFRRPGGGAIQGISAIRRGVTRFYGFATAMMGSLFQRPKHSDWVFFTSALFMLMS